MAYLQRKAKAYNQFGMQLSFKCIFDVFIRLNTELCYYVAAKHDPTTCMFKRPPCLFSLERTRKNLLF